MPPDSVNINDFGDIVDALLVARLNVGAAFARIGAEIASAISGGIRGIVFKRRVRLSRSARKFIRRNKARNRREAK